MMTWIERIGRNRCRKGKHKLKRDGAYLARNQVVRTYRCTRLGCTHRMAK